MCLFEVVDLKEEGEGVDLQEEAGLEIQEEKKVEDLFLQPFPMGEVVLEYLAEVHA